MTLLPEATSARAIRALGRFFGTATRDEVLLVYFSGHGKLDQSGRLHLCMQDTESADLLSTAVSSARIKEFADASRARNVVIVLDCCYAGLPRRRLGRRGGRARPLRTHQLPGNATG